jgi:hypothetical protein
VSCKPDYHASHQTSDTYTNPMVQANLNMNMDQWCKRTRT